MFEVPESGGIHRLAAAEIFTRASFSNPIQMQGILSRQPSKHYYENESWDIKSWVDVISIEYQSLVDHFPFNDILNEFSRPHSLQLLDVGCGSAIFPSYLDKVLADEIHFTCDLFDISPASLEQASQVLSGLEHFTTRKLFEDLIENIPDRFKSHAELYDVIWAIHSFTTVDISRMAAVIERLMDLLTPGGYLLIYQLAAKSTYQRLHQHYLSQHPNAIHETRFMQYEDSKRILNSLGIPFETHELSFNHAVETKKYALLEMYLRKSILDDSVDVLNFFADILPDYVDAGAQSYKFPQFVNFIVVRK